jgi:hypothetical protein
MDGIPGSLISYQKGAIRCEALNNVGRVSVFTCEGHYLPDLKVRLFSPQIRHCVINAVDNSFLNGTSPTLTQGW